jgi:hypothetical protein
MVIVITGVPVKGGVIIGGDCGSVFFEQEKRNTRKANLNFISKEFINLLA